MSDLAALGLFLACLALTFALVWACEWLRPRDVRPSPASHGDAAAPEARR